MYVKELVKVPWFIVPSKERRDVRPDPPVETEMEESGVEDRLEALGYVDR